MRPSFSVGELIRAGRIGIFASAAWVASATMAVAQFSVREIPPDIAFGGRTVAVAAAASPRGDYVLAASESGGVFQSEDDGETWRHIPFDSASGGLRYPHRLNDLRISPRNTSVVVMATDADWRNVTIGGRAQSGGGIWVSTNRGGTWSKPATAEPPAPCGGRANAWSVAFESGTPNVYVGTDCGLAVSNDDGATWTHQQIQGRTEATFSVIAGNGIVDVCSVTGHFRLNVGSGAWSGGNLPFPCVANAPHTLAASPVERNVIFATVFDSARVCRTDRDGNPVTGDYKVYESYNGGGSWMQLMTWRCGLGRPPYVTTSAADSAESFALFHGDGRDMRRIASCRRTFASATRCASAWQRVGVDHADHMDIEYSISNRRCAAFLASDAGVYKSDDCGARWRITGVPENGFNALQLYGVFAQVYDLVTHLYIGTQDNSLWASADSGASWTPDSICCEGGWFSFQRRVSDTSPQIITGAGVGDRGNFKAAPLLTDVTDWTGPDGGGAGQPIWLAPNTYIQWGNLNRGEMWRTTESGDSDSWDRVLQLQGALGGGWSPSGTGWTTVGAGSNPTLYIPIEQRVGGPVQLARVTNLYSGSPTVARADSGLNAIGIHVRGDGTFVWKRMVSADPKDPTHLIAVDADSNQIRVSRNSGGSWPADIDVTNMLRQAGAFQFDLGNRTSSFASSFAFDPVVAGRMFIGTEANGVLMSTDDGAFWIRIPGTEDIPVVTSFAFDEVRDKIFVSSYGRGLWSMEVPTPRDGDGFENNDEFAVATPASEATLRQWHINPADALTSETWRGETFERWLWWFERASLHDWVDRDFYRLRLPDPTRAHASHPGIMECGFIAREPTIPAIEESAHVVVTANLRVSTGLRSDEPVRVYAVEGGRLGRELTNDIRCPWTEGIREIAVVVGDRADPRFNPRTTFTDYNLQIDYRINVQYVPRPARWLVDLIVAREVARLGALPCRNGFFPYCFAQDHLRFALPDLEKFYPDCIADGPGCWDFYGFHWQDADRPLVINLTAAIGLRGAKLIMPNGKEINARYISGGLPKFSQQKFNTGAALQRFEGTKPMKLQLVAQKLEPGYYALAFNGPPQEIFLRYNVMGEEGAPDENQDGLPDYFYPISLLGLDADCIAHNSAGAEVKPDGGAFLVTDGRSRIALADTKEDGAEIAKLVRRHTHHCYIGRNNRRPNRSDYIMLYWRGASGLSGDTKDADCLPYDPAKLEIRDNGAAGWLLTDGRSRMKMLDNKTDAERALAVAKTHKAHCYVGRSNQRQDRQRYITEYWK